MLKCEKLLELTSKQYSKIENAAKLFRKREITAEEFNRLTWHVLEEIDKIIKDYESK